MSSKTPELVKVAVLHQAIDPPIINGVRKPAKPGGYQDSGADIAYTLQYLPNIKVLTSTSSPNPDEATGWTFPDTSSGILSALSMGATHIWANTILFSSHPLQVSPALDKYQDQVKIIGQPPNLVQVYDDKEFVNNLLRSKGFTLPKSWTLASISSNHLEEELGKLDLAYPVIAKPIRGRGSSGVLLCHDPTELIEHINFLFISSPTIMLEEYLAGEECTVTVMPPSDDGNGYWALPIVRRFNHEGGIAPYNGVVAVSENSKVVGDEKQRLDGSYGEVTKECVEVARLLGVTAPIRIDVRHFTKETKSKFALFDVNMKPNMTGPSRPGRENQTSLSGMAAEAIGWDYSRLLQEMIKSACTLRKLRGITLPDFSSPSND